jgi:lysophospholipase L1-like esterase
MSPQKTPLRRFGDVILRRPITMIGSRRVRLMAAALLLALLPMAHPATATTSVGPRTFYLALGDSLAWGYQPNWNIVQGYVEDLYLHLLQRGAQRGTFFHLPPRGTFFEINMACSGETAATFIAGGCPFARFKKYPYAGPQLAAALTFIRQHRGQVSPVTIDIGANDLLPLVNPSTCAEPAPAVVTQALATFDANFSSILAQLRTALQGTGDLVTMNYYFPYQNQCPNLLLDVEQFNQHLASDAQQNGVPVVDVFSAFGGAAVPNANLCRYTWICSSYHDIHATTQGHAVIAAAVEATLGY